MRRPAGWRPGVPGRYGRLRSGAGLSAWRRSARSDRSRDCRLGGRVAARPRLRWKRADQRLALDTLDPNRAAARSTAASGGRDDREDVNEDGGDIDDEKQGTPPERDRVAEKPVFIGGGHERPGVLRGLTTLPLIGGSVTLIGSPTYAAGPVVPGTFTTCAAWRPFERRALMLGCFGRQRGDMTRFMNPGSRFHAWSGPDAAGPGLDARSRAPIVPAAVGYPLTDPEAEAQWSGVSPGPDDLRSPLDSSQALTRPHPAGGSARLKCDPEVTQGAYRRSEKSKISIPINMLECIRLLGESFSPESGVPRRRMCLDVGRTTGTLR